MEIIIKTLQEAIQINLAYVILLEIIVAGLFIFNTILGAILGTISNGWDWKHFVFGLLKNLGMLLVIIGVCYVLNLFVLTMNLIGTISIDTDFLTTMEIMGILVAWGVDLTKDIVEKIKSYKQLKYISYEDIHYNDGNGVSQ